MSLLNLLLALLAIALWGGAFGWYFKRELRSALRFSYERLLRLRL